MHHLRRLSEATQESPPHAVAIGDSGLPSDDFDRMATLLHQQAGGLDSQCLDSLDRRLAGLGVDTRLNWHGPRWAASASCSTVGGLSRLRFAYASTLWIRSDLSSSSSSADNCDSMASARSNPAVIPAEVHTGSSTMKMRAASTFTFGNRACKSRAQFPVADLACARDGWCHSRSRNCRTRRWSGQGRVDARGRYPARHVSALRLRPVVCWP
jgi:hypothetical protein